MANYSINPTYYRVTWDQASPTNYTGLTGTRAGGVDGVSARRYNNRISVTGTVSIVGTPLADGDTMLINGKTVEFNSADTLSTIIEKINMASLLTNVIAHNGVGATYVTVTNSASDIGDVIELEEGTGALAKLGFTAGSYKSYPRVVGGAFTSFTNGDTFAINGITITMTTAGGLDQAGAVATVNAQLNNTGVIATKAAATVQLSSINDQPFTTSGANASKLGFPAGIYGGSPSTLQQSIDKTLANSRWQMVINQLEIFSTPFLMNDLLGTGNYDGSAPLTTLSFTVGYEHPDQISTEDELNPGTVLTGTAAIKRAVARGLTASYTGNFKVFDPTTETRGSYAIRGNPSRIMTLTADGIASPSNISTLEGNISVEMIAYA